MNHNFLPKIKNFFLPKFSERDIITLVLILFIVLADPGLGLTSNIIDQFSSPISPDRIIKSVFGAIFAVLILIGILYKLLFLALKNRALSPREKKTIAGFYYSTLCVITFSSIMERIGAPEMGLINIMEFIFIIYILFKSFVTLILLGLLQKMTLEEVYAGQMTDEQVNMKELIILLIFVPTVYILLRSSNSILSTISLTFFYLSSFFSIIGKYFSQNISTKIKA